MQQLFLVSYNGLIYTLQYAEGESPKKALKIIAESKDCAVPSWVTLDSKRRRLYGLANDKEKWSGTLKTFLIQADGSLEEKSSVPAPFGAAFSTLYDDGKALAAAYYYDPAVATYNVEDCSHIRKLQELRWPEIGPGPGRAQEHSRPHQTYIDPTGRYLIAVDCGADRIHVFTIGADHEVTEVGGLDLPRPSFPRHVAMVVVGGKTLMYILNQDICTLATYRVEYLAEGGLSFHQEGEDINLFVRNERVVNVDLALRPTASHMVLSPDNRFVMCSMRRDDAFEITSPLDGNSTMLADSILTLKVHPETGALSLAHEQHAGGNIPRQFCMNPSGDRIAICQEANGWVSIYERDVETGKFGKLLAILDGLGEPVCIQWDA
ncbi:uncharacterized protein PV06_07481 [Exophiala oligosperma]|uniref:6-phosphogluconolactonase n=1 Tax=Exophiala oligosperma TaxID=215243 RepID=A0A0D2DAX9_9EURO|nr:uncharacterized protein PV06_07481 [Exophiala oligosperma]KIW40268.1 hypothetical protein PV06_07481 [Exophiala oligosperma]